MKRKLFWITLVLFTLVFSSSAYAMELKEFDTREIMLPIIVFGLLNSLRPVVFLMIVFLLSMIAIIDERKILRIGLSFTAGVFIGYLIIGLGLIKLHRSFGFLSYVVVAFSLFVGFYKIFKSFGLINMTLQNPLREKSNKVLEKATSPISAFGVGVIMPFLALICTLPPYLLITSILSQSFNLTTKVALLVLYNVIFIVPLLVVTLGFHYGRKHRRIAETVDRLSRFTGRGDLAMGVILVIVSVIYLLFLFGFF
ncbi:putative cytochrome C-type biogenesis protein [Pyrococcus sp. NA2]|uniref:cytochrome c biogenesis protein n=1 Tax=Pyrococcus sp. (strain NA2) TaxID=342949 RepID=UPI000209A942|nr:cytochrome c biogenesis protein [Pyrococcus sp. NA2]AEC52492.1 putative cytochrome C-type biogenesis protein [Pyrococcus sp. NA2]